MKKLYFARKSLPSFKKKNISWTIFFLSSLVKQLNDSFFISNFINIWIFWTTRDRCDNCNCFRDSHDIRLKDYTSAIERLQLNKNTMERLNFEKPSVWYLYFSLEIKDCIKVVIEIFRKKLASLERGFSWQPSGLSSQEVNSNSINFWRNPWNKIRIFLMFRLTCFLRIIHAIAYRSWELAAKSGGKRPWCIRCHAKILVKISVNF